MAEDELLRGVREATPGAGLPDIGVSPTQGALLALLCRISGARRVLEFGTLAGYSTIWMARAVGEPGLVTTLELNEDHAAVARRNFDAAGVADRVRLIVGRAADTAEQLITDGEEPFDLIFIDADKPSNPVYLEAALELSRPGTVIVVDNVVRRGAVIDSTSSDLTIRGTREVLALLGADPRLTATAIQTVGSKGWDGFALARVN